MNSNAGGRNKKKQRAAKGGSGRFTNKLRYADDGEMYACVERNVGNGRALVVCTDGRQYSCVIRQKFKGRYKRGNMMSAGVWCLVGVREWETRKADLGVCDLLHVYQDSDVTALKRRETTNLSAIIRVEEDLKAANHSDKMDDNIVFTDDRGADNDASTEEYLLSQLDAPDEAVVGPVVGGDDDIDFDDI